MAARQSLTIDEFAHLPAGITYLQQLTFRLYPHNPPLPRVLPALAALTQQPRMFYEGSWQSPNPNHLAFAEEHLLANTEDTAAIERYFASFQSGRRVIALWSTLTIPILFLWGSWWFGRGSGWLAAFLWAFCPNIITAAGLVTTDIAAASMSVTASYLFARWLDVPDKSRAIAAGLVLGLALLTKFSVVLLVPMWGIWAIVYFRRRQRLTPTQPPIPWRGQLIVLYCIGLFVLNAGYLFEGSFTPLDDYAFVSHSLTRPRQPGDGPPGKDADPKFAQVHRERVNRFRGSPLGLIPCPLPRDYLIGFDVLKWESEGKYEQYLRGQWQPRGYWDYYLYGLLVKWPLSTWLLLVVAAINAWQLRRTRTHSLLPWLTLGGVPLAMLSLLQDVNLGLRYALPAFPFLFLLAGTAASDLTSSSRWKRIACWAAVAWNLVAIARIHPHELAYFNELAGGPARGRFHLVDSNLDWGQDLNRLAAWVHRHPEWQNVRIAYWGPTPPELVGLSPYRVAPRDLRQMPAALRYPTESDDPLTWGPQPGKFAISVNFERGMGFRMPCPQNLWDKFPLRSPARVGITMLSVPKDSYRYFQEFEPRVEPEIGYSILLYEVSLEQANRVRKTMGLPLLSDSTIP